jgi:hypothetical protein
MVAVLVGSGVAVAVTLAPAEPAAADPEAATLEVVAPTVEPVCRVLTTDLNVPTPTTPCVWWEDGTGWSVPDESPTGAAPDRVWPDGSTLYADGWHLLPVEELSDTAVSARWQSPDETAPAAAPAEV